MIRMTLQNSPCPIQLLGENDFDLSTDDWAELAKNGTIKYEVPCMRERGWDPSPVCPSLRCWAAAGLRSTLG